MRIVLYQPQIPQNTGNIVRTCKVTGTDLVLINPGFDTSDRMLKRAGLDYWEGVNVIVDTNIDLYLQEPFYFFSSKANKIYTKASYTPDATLIFGAETTGLPEELHRDYPKQFLTLPMKPNVRCLNLATSAGIALFEAWRQCNFQYPAELIQTS